MRWILAIIALWVLLSLDFILEFDLLTHLFFHTIIGILGTYYIVKNKDKFQQKRKKR